MRRTLTSAQAADLTGQFEFEADACGKVELLAKRVLEDSGQSSDPVLNLGLLKNAFQKERNPDVW